MKKSALYMKSGMGTPSEGSPIPLKGWLKKIVKKKVKKKVANKIKINHKKGTVTEITPTSEVTRTSWPNVKPGQLSPWPGTSTLPSGKVVPYDATLMQIIKP